MAKMFPDSRRPRRLPRVINAIASKPMGTCDRRQAGHGRGDLLHRRRGRNRHGKDVIDQQRRRRDQRRKATEVVLGDRVRTAATRVCVADLPVAGRDNGQHQGNRERDVDRCHQADGACDEQDVQDLIGGVRGRADGVRAEDGQRLLLVQALADLLFGCQRTAEEDALGVDDRAAHPRLGCDGCRLRAQRPGTRVAEVGRVRPIDANAYVTGAPALQRLTAPDHSRLRPAVGPRWHADSRASPHSHAGHPRADASTTLDGSMPERAGIGRRLPSGVE